MSVTLASAVPLLASHRRLTDRRIVHAVSTSWQSLQRTRNNVFVFYGSLYFADGTVLGMPPRSVLRTPQGARVFLYVANGLQNLNGKFDLSGVDMAYSGVIRNDA